MTVGEQIWGTWKAVAQCAPGYFVSGYNIAIQPPQGIYVDNAAATGLMMRCRAWTTNLAAASYDVVVQPVGVGSWQGWRVCDGPRGFIYRAAVRIEAPIAGDNTGSAVLS